MMGHTRWTSKTDNKFKSVVNKFKDGLGFTMTKVSFSNDVKKQFIHTPIQTVVNLAETQMAPLLDKKETKRYPEPPSLTQSNLKWVSKRGSCGSLKYAQ